MTINDSKKEIAVNPKILLNILLSFILGFSILFAIEHRGKVNLIMGTIPPIPGQKLSLTAEAPPDYPVKIIYFDSPFGNRMTISAEGWKNKDVYWGDGKFHDYSNKVKIYFDAVAIDYKYGLLFSGIIFILILFFARFKLKFNLNLLS